MNQKVSKICYLQKKCVGLQNNLNKENFVESFVICCKRGISKLKIKWKN